ncbi:MAG TPA: 4-hydroxy-tetrahydrodipicolinate reductase [Rhizomicrobium sp.]|jgi:4-hydroxy-tetrahydrodipicolinate reductase|nr:4-hydroxy-tetrahydrodipicolinate reductase [Rhizomicrobium sp.]
MTQLRIVVAGAAGRMGRTLIRAIAETGDCILAAALVRPGSPDNDSSEAPLRTTGDPAMALRKTDAIVDFSTPQNSLVLAKYAAQLHVPHIIGTTGFSAEEEAQIATASTSTAIVKSGNMSLGIALLSGMVKRAAAALPDFDIEILEMHHRKKVDAPSGTALLLGRAAADGRNTKFEDVLDLRREQSRARTENTIGFASLRGGTVVGEHQVIFAGPHERLMLSHTAEDRTIFARGALAAARWSQGKPAGLYGMQDVLGDLVP